MLKFKAYERGLDYLHTEMITERQLHLAIPKNTTPEQILQLERGVQ